MAIIAAISALLVIGIQESARFNNVIVAIKLAVIALFIICAAGFTVASVLCAMAQNIEQMVLFRLLQGGFGAVLIPLSQTTLFDAFPRSQRGTISSEPRIRVTAWVISTAIDCDCSCSMAMVVRWGRARF